MAKIKSIIKEIFIMLLLCIAIILILGILFYDYIPSNRVIPTKEAYVTPENVKTEIEEKITELEATENTYEITSSQLDNYKQTSSYKPGKKDPFSLEETIVDSNSNNGTTVTSKNETGSTTVEEDNNTIEDTNIDKNSTGTFFNDEGIK